MTDRAKSRIEAEIKKEVRTLFENIKRKLGVDASLDLEITSSVWGPPIVGENVYAETFPFEKPPRIWIEVFAPEDVTRKEIVDTLCHELIHIQHPELREESAEFKRRFRDASGDN